MKLCHILSNDRWVKYFIYNHPKKRFEDIKGYFHYLFRIEIKLKT